MTLFDRFYFLVGSCMSHIPYTMKRYIMIGWIMKCIFNFNINLDGITPTTTVEYPLNQWASMSIPASCQRWPPMGIKHQLHGYILPSGSLHYGYGEAEHMSKIDHMFGSWVSRGSCFPVEGWISPAYLLFKTCCRLQPKSALPSNGTLVMVFRL